MSKVYIKGIAGYNMLGRPIKNDTGKIVDKNYRFSLELIDPQLETDLSTMSDGSDWQNWWNRSVKVSKSTNPMRQGHQVIYLKSLVSTAIANNSDERLSINAPEMQNRILWSSPYIVDLATGTQARSIEAYKNGYITAGTPVRVEVTLSNIGGNNSYNINSIAVQDYLACYTPAGTSPTAVIEGYGITANSNATFPSAPVASPQEQTTMHQQTGFTQPQTQQQTGFVQPQIPPVQPQANDPFQQPQQNGFAENTSAWGNDLPF